MTDLYALLGIPAPRPGRSARARTRCRDCHRPVYVDQLVYGLGRCCAERAGLIVIRYRFPHQHQTGETLLDHLPKEARVEPFPQARIDVAGMDAPTAHAKIVAHAHTMISDPTGEIAAAFPHGITAAADDAFRGLAGILERHAPTNGALKPAGDYSDARCGEIHDLEASVAWPCADYRDAARGLATGLPEARA